MIARSVGTFVQVGETAFNTALMTEISFSAECVYFYYSPREEETDEVPIILRGESRLAFLDWWQCQAMISAKAERPDPTDYIVCPP